MTPRRRRPGVGGPGGSAEIVSIAAHASYRPGYKKLASAKVLAGREALGMSHEEFAGYLAVVLGWNVTPEAVGHWERGSTPPTDVALACDAAAGLDAIEALGQETALLDTVPHGFATEALAGTWVTAYQFAHAGSHHHHADVAHITAEGERQVRAVNHPPEPRTQGRSSPFRNEIEARLFGRHLIGTWRNTSDTRYFGSLHLAVLPGETVMEGHYTGLASDIQVSGGWWRWVRLGSGDLSGVTLREPCALYELVMTRTQDDPPLTADDIREEA
jgi:transcriptional regulator with XRE-family HTH domain